MKKRKEKKKKKKRENFRSDHHAQQHAFLTESNSISLENSKGTCVDFHEAHTRERERERPSLECYNERPAISGCRSKKGQMYKRSVEGI